MSRFDFCSGSYTSQSLNANAQRCVNLYPEIDESGSGKSKMMLYPVPGTALFITFSESGAIRGQFEFNGRLFCVAGPSLYEIFATGASTKLGTVTTDGNPVSMCANETQLLIASNGLVFIFYLATTVDSVTGLPVPAGTFQQVAASNFTLSTGNAPVIQVAFCDSFFLALIANSQTVCISNVLDGNNWNLNGQIVVNVFPDNVVSMDVDHREVWLKGRKKTVVYFASGSLSVFDVSPGGYIEQGSGATFSTCLLDNSQFWVGGDDRGNAIGWRATGYSAQRVTTHAIEFAWQNYPKISDAVSYSYQDQGHSFWVVYFPSANNFLGATWIYDTATGLWHERNSLDPVTGNFSAHRSQNHAFAFGKHIVGDWKTATLRQMDIFFYDDMGLPIQRLRAAPHISTEQEWIFHKQLQVDLEAGNPQTTYPAQIYLQDANGKFWLVWIDDSGAFKTVNVPSGIPSNIQINDQVGSVSWQLGINTSGALTVTSITFNAAYPKSFPMASVPSLGNSQIQITSGALQSVTGTSPGPAYFTSREPQAFLRWSDDGGHTWSNIYMRGSGNIGEYKKRIIWRRLGRSRDRVYEFSSSDPIPWRIVDAYLLAVPGFVPQERLIKQYGKSA